MTNEELRKILDNAPSGATHVLIDHEFNVTFAKRNPESGNWFWLHIDCGWLEFDRMPVMQDIISLADLREILALRDQNQAMKDILRDAIGLMRATGVTSGWHQVANVAESLVNSEFTTGQESQQAKGK